MENIIKWCGDSTSLHTVSALARAGKAECGRACVALVGDLSGETNASKTHARHAALTRIAVRIVGLQRARLNNAKCGCGSGSCRGCRCRLTHA